jgi:hypothetical protein
MCFLDRCFGQEMRVAEIVLDTRRLLLGSGTDSRSYFVFSTEALALIKPSLLITPLYYLSIVKINAYM